jgi:TolA-binding protein
MPTPQQNPIDERLSGSMLANVLPFRGTLQQQIDDLERTVEMLKERVQELETQKPPTSDVLMIGQQAMDEYIRMVTHNVKHPLR